MKIALCKTHDGIEAYLKSNTFVAQRLGIAFAITDWKGSGAREFQRLIRDLPRLGRVVGDKAYSSRVNCQAVADKKGKPFLCFKANATGKEKGYSAWQISFRADNPDEKNEGISHKKHRRGCVLEPQKVFWSR